MSLKRRNVSSLYDISEGQSKENELVFSSSRQAAKGVSEDERVVVDAAKRCKKDDGSHHSLPSRGHVSRRNIARVATEVAGHVEMVALMHSLPRCNLKLNERTELALLELNILLKRSKHLAGEIHLKNSHSWCRNLTQKIIANVSATVRADPALTLVRHLVSTTYPRCSAAAAAKHVFEAPPWLQSWCERYHVEVNNVVVLELTLFDAGRASNPMFFPLLGGGEYCETC
jgi:hypothetical protein